MLKKNIVLSEQHDQWIKSQINSGPYKNESEVIHELIQERQMRDLESPEEIAAIRSALLKAEESVKRNGYSKRSVDEIWNAALKKHITKHR